MENEKGVEEVIIAEEQDALNKPIHLGFFHEIEGTLILTSKRLIFACGNEKEESFSVDITKDEPIRQKVADEARNFEMNTGQFGGILVYSEVEDLKNIPSSPKNLLIPISSITSVSGHKEFVERPTLKVSWEDPQTGSVKSTEFQEVLEDTDRRKNLNDWASVIEQLKAGSLKIQKLPPAPPIDSIEGKIAYIMGDMQDKGLIEIEQQAEDAFKVDLDPDEVHAHCEKLVSMGFLDKVNGKNESGGGDSFYRKRSPVGIDDLSS